MKLRLPRWPRRRYLCQPCKAGVHRHAYGDGECVNAPPCRCDVVPPPPVPTRTIQPRGDLL